MNAIAKARTLFARPTLCRVFASPFSVNTGSKEHIDGILKDKKVVVFMKGTPDEPKCGFSNAVVQILKFHGVDKYDSHNILEDESLRQGMLRLSYSNNGFD